MIKLGGSNKNIIQKYSKFCLKHFCHPVTLKVFSNFVLFELRDEIQVLLFCTQAKYMTPLLYSCTCMALSIWLSLVSSLSNISPSCSLSMM